MKKYLLLCMLLISTLSARRVKVDGIKVLIYGENETIIITDSEVERPGLDGQPKACKDNVFENMVYLDAKRMGWVFSDDEINKNWEDVKRQNNLSEDDMQRITAQAGYTVPEAKQQLGKMSAVSQMFDFKIKSGLVVTRTEVQEFYEKNPEYRQAEYLVSRAVIPFSDLEPKESMKTRLEAFVQTGKGNVRVAWAEPFWIRHNQVAEDKQFIYTMKIGELSMPVEAFNGFEMFKVVDKKPVCLIPLNERYDDIAAQLKRPKYERLLDDYKKELEQRLTVVYY